MSGSSLWWNGPKWLANREEWPHNLVTLASPVTEVEAKAMREVLSVAQPTTSSEPFEELLEKH